MVNFIEHNFYIDDTLCSMATDEEAISLPDLSGEASVTHHSLGLLWDIKSNTYTYSGSLDKEPLFAVEFSLW